MARNTVGVSAVTNRIKVRPIDEYDSDDLASRIRESLARDPYVERFEVDVDVVGNTAYLSGSVDSYFEKGQADDIAARIEGITNVVNTIDVRGDAALAYDPYVYDDYIYETDWYDFEPVKTFQTDAAIKESINDELWWSPFIEADEVDVSVENGVATLSGQVDSWSEWNAATENAYEAGASWVVNDLEVK